MADDLQHLTRIPGLTEYFAAQEYLKNRDVRDQQRELQQKFIQEREALGPNPPPQALIGLGMKYLDPKALVHEGQTSLDRREAIAARLQTAHELAQYRLDNLQRQRENDLARIKSDEGKLALDDWYKKETLRLKEHQGDVMAELKKMGLDIAKQKADATTTAKPLPAPLQKQLTETAELADATSRFKTTFKDEYGGHTLTGELTNVLGKTFGDRSGQTQWWQDYELHQSQVRNKLFGSALTAPEIEAWNKSAINPRMDPGEIRKNLARRDQIESTAINRLMKGAAAAYNKEQIEAFTGRSIPGATPAQVDPRFPEAPRDPSKRVRGVPYTTPKGVMTWTGTGWVPPR